MNFDSEYIAEPYFGASSSSQPKKKLPINGNFPFWLTHHPSNWELVKMGKQYVWLPILGKLHELAGCNGVQGTKSGPDATFAKMQAQKVGKTILPWELGYLTKYPAANGDYYCIKWSVPKSIGKKVINKLDSKSYNEFRKKLVEDGFIRQIDSDLIPIKIAELEHRINYLVQQQHLPEIKKQIVDIQKNIDLMVKTQ